MINKSEFLQSETTGETPPDKPKSPESKDKKLSLSELAGLIAEYNDTRAEIEAVSREMANFKSGKFKAEMEPTTNLGEYLARHSERYDAMKEKCKLLIEEKKKEQNNLLDALLVNVDTLLKMTNTSRLKERLSVLDKKWPTEKLEKMTDEEIRLTFKKEFLAGSMLKGQAIDYLLDIY